MTCRLPDTAAFTPLGCKFLTGLQVQVNLRLADLTKLGLGSLGTTRVELIESDTVHYRTTAQWSEAIHQDDAEIRGLFWVSRQNDWHRTVMLFGDRVPKPALRVASSRLELWHGKGLELVAHWANRADITLI